MKKIIHPSVGRKVWYRPSANDKLGPKPMICVGDQPLDATVLAVWSDRMVNVLVLDTMGQPFPVLSCELMQPGDEVRRDASGNVIGRYCEWMPYQIGAAARDAAALSAADSDVDS